MIDTTSPTWARAVERLQEERIAWLTTVDATGTPQAAPVWYLVEGDRIVVYSYKTARRLDNVRANPHVAFHLNTDAGGGAVVIISGTARIAPEIPAAPDSPAYLERYREWIEQDIWKTPAKFAEEYSVPIEITPQRVKVW